MKRIVASIASVGLIMTLPGGALAQDQKSQVQQSTMVECRELSDSDNFLGPNETLINGKACRPAGSPMTVNLTNTPSPTKVAGLQPTANVTKDDPNLAVSPNSGEQFLLEDGTPVKLVISENLSSADAQVGQEVSFEVVEDVLVQGIVVIPKGSTAWATITAAEHKRRMGRAGKLDLNVDKVRLADGEKALLKATKDARGGSHTGAMVGAMAATALFTLGGSALFLLMHGKDITIPKGTALMAFVQGDDVLDRSRFEKLAKLN